MLSVNKGVTEISGRGVGMDAVKTFVTTRGGHVDLIFPDLNAEPKGFVPFELVLTLPAEDVLEN